MKGSYYEGVKMKTTILIPIVAALFLSACGSSSNADSENQTTKTVTINGMSPADFYKQFYYWAEGDCRKMPNTSIYFHFQTNEGVYLEKINGHDVKVELALYMLANGTYAADYEEQEIYQYIDSGYEFLPIVRKRIEGTWEIDGNGRLLLHGLGVAMGIQYNKRPAMTLVYERDLNLPALKGKTDLLRRVSSTHGREYQDEYCRNLNK